MSDEQNTNKTEENSQDKDGKEKVRGVDHLVAAPLILKRPTTKS